MTTETPTTDPTRDLHEAALEGAIRLTIRGAKARTPQDRWAAAQGASMSWAFHQALTRLVELDPDGTAAFAADLVEELEDGSYGDDMCDTAVELGFDPQPWIDVERNPSASVAR
ncbi:hypothetical protein ADK57_32150 [Streptomyces sp. MMG1533]|uniref:hypothetical protein n=1 Tax=Streptomyces sp. MMG1533 TaxID=1415546 RepID=UPI0006ADF8EB|nr:hypothetical protein [Streptomyces sp. MMG1533]KOU59918.1 hypothetical protein ADK57_32150 [Streptomyces sp. MMG1533]